MKGMIKVALHIIGILCLAECGLHSGEIAGTGSGVETTNGFSGTVRKNGASAAKVAVYLYPEDYDVLDAASFRVDSALTDSLGRYRFDSVGAGTYNILFYSDSETISWVQGAHYPDQEDTLVQLGTTDLQKTGELVISLEGLEVKAGDVVYIKGTPFRKDITAAERDEKKITLSLPAATFASVIYADGSDEKVILENVILKPNETNAPGPFANWNATYEVTINTTAEGADIAGTLTQIPVLIALAGKNFDFNLAGKSGGDIRFSSSSGKELPFEIEKWDSLNGLAYLWVLVDTLKGDALNRIHLHSGNPEAEPRSSGSKTFDTANGFAAVWHLNEAAGDNLYRDATANHNTGIGQNLSPASPSAKGISPCLQFDGSSSRIVAANGASLNWGDSDFTAEAFVNIDAFSGNAAQIFSKRRLDSGSVGNYELQLEPKAGTNDFRLVGNVREDVFAAGDLTSRSSLPMQVWTHVAMRKQADKISLFINGIEDTSLILDGVNTSSDGDFYIGSDAYVNEWFKGLLDEVRLSNVARSSEWIKFSSQNGLNPDVVTVLPSK